MKKTRYLVLITVIAAILFLGCSNKPEETIGKFAAAVNSNDADAAGKLIALTAQERAILESNNWSGLKILMTGWRVAGDISFTGLTSEVSGASATTTGTFVTPLSTSVTVFKLVKESDFLFFSFSWKIKEWRFDIDGNSSATDDPAQIQRRK